MNEINLGSIEELETRVAPGILHGHHHHVDPEQSDSGFLE